MSSSPKRPWFRFHLLTAVLMMVAAGILVAPIVADLVTPDAWRNFDDNGNFNDPAPAIEIIVAMMATGRVVSIAFMSEWLIRRREARKS